MCMTMTTLWRILLSQITEYTSKNFFLQDKDDGHHLEYRYGLDGNVMSGKENDVLLGNLGCVSAVL